MTPNTTPASNDFVLVPRVPTPDMVKAVVRLDMTALTDPTWPEYWAAMIAAAPKAPNNNVRAALQAIIGITDDYMTSESHHPGYVLIPVERFERLRCAEAAPASSEPASNEAPGRGGVEMD